MTMEFLFALSFIVECLALILSFYFHNTQIFFLTLSLILFKLPYFFTSVLQAHLFVSLFLPFIFVIFFLKQFPKKIFDRTNLSSFILLIFMTILSFILPQNTHFNSVNLNFEWITSFQALNELGLAFFLLGGLFLILKNLRNHNFYPILAFVAMYINFLFEKSWSVKYYELASSVFCFYLLQNAYKMLFYDTLTKLPNQKKLEFFLKNKTNYIIALVHFNELKDTKEAYKELILKQIARVFKGFKGKIFILEEDFILIFKDKNTALNHLGYLESALKNTPIKLENEEFKADFQIVWQKNEGNLTQNLKSLKRKILKA